MVCTCYQEFVAWSRARSCLVFLVGAILLAGCAVQPVSGSCQLSSQPTDGLPTRGISAHRGGRVGCPDNTLGAFQRAICLGVHQIELDVRTTQDGVLVVAHDDAMTGVDGDVIRISEAALEEVTQLPLKGCRGANTCEQHIPTLEEVLAIMPRNIWINLDVKENVPEVGRQAAEVVSRRNRLAQVIFSVRDKAATAIRQFEKETGQAVWISNMNRELFRHQYIEATIASCDEFIQLVNLPFLFRGTPCKKTINALKQAGVRVNYSWLRESEQDVLEEELTDLFDRQIDFVLVDYPEAAMHAARSLDITPLIPRWDGPSPFSCSAPPTCPLTH